MTEEKPGPREAEVLRPEARPLSYAELDKQQQAALDRVIGLLTTAASAAQPPSSDRETRPVQPTPTGPYLESARCSRNILLSGERGTGKTTLMLSLAKVLSTRPDTPLDNSLPQAVADQIRALYRRLVWLETLDMEPLESEVNLLGAVLARIEDAVGARFPGLDKAPETVPLLHPGASFHDVSREMARLQTSVALTFGGNLSDRAGSLDPDTFAVESRRAERERLGLDRRFASVLAGLSGALASTVELTAPVFVLPVDDVDLNVGACVPLLRLLRSTSSPHLVVVLAADVALLSTILRLKYLGELARISTSAALSDADQGVAADLAVNALRKHLPPAQRVILGLVDPRRALALKPLGPDTKNLGHVLGKVDLGTDFAVLQAVKGFGLILGDPPPPPVQTAGGWSAGPEEKPAQFTERLELFSWPEVLRQPMRRLVDLYLDCRVRDDEEQRQHGPSVHDVTDAPLVQLAQARSQPWRDSLYKNDATFQVTGRFGVPATIQSGSVTVIERPWHGWQVSVGYSPLQLTEAAAFAGCADLLQDQWAAGISPRAHFPQAVRATLWPADVAGGEIVIDWPWVTHSTFWAYERALTWLREADKAWAGQPDAVFGSWVAVMTAQLFDVAEEAQPLDLLAPSFACGWTSLAERLKSLDVTPLGRAWLNAVGLLCTPEMGMTSPAELPPLLPPQRAEQVQSMRARRAASLPRTVRKLAGSGATSAEPAAPKTAPSRPRARRPASAPPAQDAS